MKSILHLSIALISILYFTSVWNVWGKEKKAMNIDQLKKLEDPELIRMGTEAIKKRDTYFYMNDHLQTEVNRSDGNVTVTFRMKLQFFPLDYEVETEPKDIRVGFTEKGTYIDPYDQDKDFKYFLGSDGGKKALKILKDAIKTDEKFIKSYSEDYDLFKLNEYVKITEEENLYEIGLRSDGAAHGFEIDKKTGQCINFWHEH